MSKNKKKCTEEQLENAMAGMDLSGLGILGLLKLGSETLLAGAIKAEIEEHLGRKFYEHREGSGSKGNRHGYRNTKIDTPIGQITYLRPRVTGTNFKSKFHVPYMRRPEEFSSMVCDMYINGISTRKVKGALKAVAGEKVRVSRSTVSRITQRLKTEFESFRTRNLSDVKVAYLFFDAIRVGLRIGGKGKDSILMAYAIMEDGSFSILSIGVATSESNKAWGRFVGDLKCRGLRDPLLCVSDGNAALIGAIDSNFPQSARQRCVKHRMENIMDVVPKEDQKEIRKKLNAIFYGASSLEQAKLFIQEFKKEYSKKYTEAVRLLETDLNQCLTYYLFPRNHWVKIRTSNKIERLNAEIRRRLNVIGRHPSEEGCLALVYQVTKNYAFPQQRVMVNDLIRKLWEKIRTDRKEMLQQLELDFSAA